MNGISLREDCGLWWPDYDYDPVKCLSFVRKGLKDMDLSIKHCRQRRVCVQAGGHVGLWPMRLAASFDKVYTFECEPLLAECIRRNILNAQALTPQSLNNIVVSNLALGAFEGEVKMRSAVSAGSWSINPLGKHTAQQTTIDALCLTECDALFLDVEAYEVEVLQGAANTIKRFRPVIHVEELPRSGEAIRAHMRALKYRRKEIVHSDAIYIPGER